jgi:Caenorhabditis protein of unknown function, DUF268
MSALFHRVTFPLVRRLRALDDASGGGRDTPAKNRPPRQLCQLCGIVALMTILHQSADFLAGGMSDKVMVLSPLQSLEGMLIGSKGTATSDPLLDWKLQLYRRLDAVKSKCGVLCTLNSPKEIHPYEVSLQGWTHWKPIQIPGWETSPASSSVEAAKPGTKKLEKRSPTQCDVFMRMEEVDVADHTVPFDIPDELRTYYSLNGTIELGRYKTFFKDIYLEKGVVSWSKELLDSRIERSNNGKMRGNYGVPGANLLRSELSHLPMRNSSVLVIGSKTPWVEAISLALGAARVMTLEYATINSEHPRHSTATPAQFRQMYESGELEPFDIVVTHSSVEHSGLGRYGDALNPWGDMLMMARAWCVTTRANGKGYLYLGIPTGRDGIEYNAHRIYGRHRWPLVTVNWEPLLPGGAGHGGPSQLTRDGSELDREWSAAQPNGGTGFLFRKALV